MSPEKQRIAIAEFCGWTILEPEVHPAITYEWAYPPGKNSGTRDIIPDYTNDLNAIHEAEKLLPWKDEGPATSQRRRYLMNLESVISGLPDRHGERPNRVLSIPFATAQQRAEALLRTIGKWEN